MEPSNLDFSSVVGQIIFLKTPVKMLFANQIHLNRQHGCLSAVGVTHSDLLPECLLGAVTGLTLGDTAEMDAGKATVFSGSRGEPRDTGTHVYGVQRVGKGSSLGLG